MSRPHTPWAILAAACLAAGWAAVPGWAQEAASTGTVPVSMLVSVEAKHGKEVPVVHREDVRVLQGNDRLRVTDWVPLQNEQAGLELCILVDEASDTGIAAQFDDLRAFINAQPATTAIAVAYMRNSTAAMVQNFTKDHTEAGKALRMPIGVSASGSPYLALSDLVKRWPASESRHVVLMVSDGIDWMSGGPADPYLEEAIDRAQRAGVQVYTLFASGAGHFGHSFWRIYWGQNNLSQIADETGAESYFQGYQTPVAFAPFLTQFADRLNHQFRLTFLAKPKAKAGFQRVKVATEVPNADLVGADRVYVPAAK